jgi:iron(III) transport system ATP-binding protein
MRQTTASAHALSVEGLTLDYGTLRAVDAISFVVDRGQILCLLGSSGSGKSSVLRLIAGLERPTAGRIVIDDTVVAAPGLFIEPEQRRVGMVFQDFALFPHLTVHANVAFGLRGCSRDEVNDTVRSLLTDVGLADRAGSFPHTLSGGERQRIALARALAPQPRILLMDEPFSSLDARLRDKVRQHTIELLRRRGTTTILVTHDPGEAMRAADRIGVLSEGRLEQYGTAAEVYRQPCSPQMAHSFGAVNTLAARVENGALRTPLGDFQAPPSAEAGPAVVCIRPQGVSLHRGDTGVRACVTGVICVGDASEVRLRVDDLEIIARIPDVALFVVGDHPRISVDPSHLLVFPQRDASSSAVA